MVTCVRWCSPFLVPKTELPHCTLLLNEEISFSSITLNKLMQFETVLQKASSLQSQMVTCFPNLKLRRTNWFVGLRAKEIKIKRAWKCYMHSFSSLQELSSCALSFLNSRKISLRVKKVAPKQMICFNEEIFHWFLPHVSL